MFPNVRLMIVAVVASVFVLSCGFGVFAALRVNHEPLARLPSVTAPVQLAADNPAPTSVTIAPGTAFGSHLQFSYPPKPDDGPESTAAIRPAVQPPVVSAVVPTERAAVTEDGAGVISVPSEREAKSSTPEADPATASDLAPNAAAAVVQPAVTTNGPPQDIAAPVAQLAAAASPAHDNAAVGAQPAVTANDLPQDSAAPVAQPAMTANDPPQDSTVPMAPATVAASPAQNNAAAAVQPAVTTSDPPQDSADTAAQPVAAAGDPSRDSAVPAAQPTEAASDPAQDDTVSVAAAPAGDQSQPGEEPSQSKPERAIVRVARRKPVARATVRFARKIVRKAAPVPMRPRFAVETYRVRKPRTHIRSRAFARSYAADPSAMFPAPNFQSAPPFMFGSAPIKARRTARRAAVNSTAVGGPFVAPPSN